MATRPILTRDQLARFLPSHEAIRALEMTLERVGPLASSYSVGALLVGNGTDTLVGIDDTAVGNVLLSGGLGAPPVYGKVNLTVHVTGTLPVANGGTGLTAGTSGGILGFTATGTLASSALLDQNRLVLGGGVGATPGTPLGLGTVSTVLHGNAGGAPTWGAVSLTADVSGVLPLANGGTNANLTASVGGIAYSDATGLAILAGTATANKILMSGSSAAPVWSTPTYPNAAPAAGKIIRGDGTNFAASTFTIPDTFAAGSMPYASAANVLSALALGSANRKLFVNAAGTAPEWGGSGFFVGSLSRNLASASADVAYTGVGFKGSAIIFFVAGTGGTDGCWGLDDGTNRFVMGQPGAAAMFSDTTSSIWCYQGAGVNQKAFVLTFDADGFTLRWTRNGAAAGTLSVGYLVIR
jgi:hypothetical protein